MNDLHDLLDAYIDGTLDAEGREALDTALRESRELRNELIRRLDLHAALGWRARGPRPQLSCPVETEAPARAGWIGPAVSIAAALLIIGAVAAVYLIGFAGDAGVVDRPARRVAVLLGSDRAEWVGTNPIEVGQDVTDTRLALASGTIQMDLAGGGAVMIHGDSDVFCHSPRHMSLSRGWMRVRNAPGFRIDLPSGASVVDISTEFEVSVSPDGVAGVRVISGSVRIEPADKDEPARVYETGEVVAMDDSGNVVDDAIAWIPMTGLDNRPSIEHTLIGTGEGVDHGATDARWKIVRAVHDPLFTERDAIVMSSPDASYVQPDDSAARWVSVTGGAGNAPSGEVYTFRTIVNVRDVDPSTVKVAGRFAADNTVIAVRVNGRPVDGVFQNEESFKELHGFVIDAGWIGGDNVVEFDLRNGAQRDGGSMSPMGLLVDWKLTAMPDWVGRL